MKNFMDKVVTGFHHFSFKDYAVYEFCVFFWGLAIAKIFPGILGLSVWFYIILALAATAYVFYRMGQEVK